jgi:hypothetical protein
VRHRQTQPQDLREGSDATTILLKATVLRHHGVRTVKRITELEAYRKLAIRIINNV